MLNNREVAVPVVQVLSTEFGLLRRIAQQRRTDRQGYRNQRTYVPPTRSVSSGDEHLLTSAFARGESAGESEAGIKIGGMVVPASGSPTTEVKEEDPAIAEAAIKILCAGKYFPF